MISPLHCGPWATWLQTAAPSPTLCWEDTKEESHVWLSVPMVDRCSLVEKIRWNEFIQRFEFTNVDNKSHTFNVCVCVRVLRLWWFGTWMHLHLLCLNLYLTPTETGSQAVFGPQTVSWVFTVFISVLDIPVRRWPLWPLTCLIQISSSGDGRLCLWDLQLGQQLREICWNSSLSSICCLVRKKYSSSALRRKHVKFLFFPTKVKVKYFFIFIFVCLLKR